MYESGVWWRWGGFSTSCSSHSASESTDSFCFHNTFGGANCFILAGLLLHCRQSRQKLNDTKLASSERCAIGNLKRGTTFWKNITSERETPHNSLWIVVCKWVSGWAVDPSRRLGADTAANHPVWGVLVTDAKVLQQFPTRGIQRNTEQKCVWLLQHSALWYCAMLSIKKLPAKSSFIANRPLFCQWVYRLGV